MPLGQPYDPGRPATLADHYDPVKVEAQHEAVMDKILSLKRELETKTGLAQFMGIAPQHADPQTGQVNVLSALSSDQGKAWANKYPELAYNVMDKAGMITGGGKVTNMGESVKEYLAGTGRDMSNPQGEKAGYAFFATPEGQKGWKQFNIDKKISTGSEGALEAVLHDKNSTPEQKESAKAALKDKIKQSAAKQAANTTAQLNARSRVQADQYNKLDPASKDMLINTFINNGTLPKFTGGMAGVSGALAAFYNDVARYAKDNNLDIKNTWVRQAVSKSNVSSLGNLQKNADMIGRAEKQAGFMLDRLDAMNDKLTTQFPTGATGQQVYNWVMKQTNDPGMAAMYLYGLSGSREYLKIVTGSAASISELSQTAQQSADQTFDLKKMGPALKATISAARLELAGTKQSYQKQLKEMSTRMTKGEVVDPDDVQPWDPTTGKPEGVTPSGYKFKVIP